MAEVVTRMRDAAAGYAPGQGRPLRGYLTALGAYAGLAGGLIGLARLTGRRAPERVPAHDVVLMSIATHKVSRMLAKDSVTSPLRAPFTRYQGPSGDAELGEEVRGTGLRHSVGELVSCPFCLSVWVATGFAAGLVFAPRFTRLVATTFTAVAVSDALQLGYAAAQQLPKRADPTS
ncbi:MAG: hypothetical protein AUI10_08895 [Actinobacteria bacterium 13_2_20CM_2_72_6]|nr:MAG: hypothetical protein AUI10_08895 [Actinobacteria bacterium 13_2_20CM_2_72_6]